MLHLADGTQIDFALLERALFNLPSKLAGIAQMPGAARVPEAIALLDKLSHDRELAEFLTLPAYDYLD